MAHPLGVAIPPITACALQEHYQSRGVLLIWTVTTGTSDLGTRFAARPHRIGKGESRPLPLYLVADTLHALHAMLPPGLTRMPADPADDPVIVEIWL